MQYRLSKEALNDIEKIWIYTFENWSIEQADHYVNLLFDEFDYLCRQPNSGFDFGKIRKDYFRVKVKSHIVFHKVNSIQNTIEIIRVLHEVMDIESHILK